MATPHPFPRPMREKLSGPYRELKGDFCFYCHGPRESLDHFIPVAYASIVVAVEEEKKVLIPCCRSCNSTARDKYFSTFAAKQDYILERRLRWKPAHSAKSHFTKKELGSVSAPRRADKTSMLLSIVTSGEHGERLKRIYHGWRMLEDAPPKFKKRLMTKFKEEFIDSHLPLRLFFQERLIECSKGLHPTF